MSDARYPVFDHDGKYLYFTASTDSGPSLEPDIRSCSTHRDAQHLRRRCCRRPNRRRSRPRATKRRRRTRSQRGRQAGGAKGRRTQARCAEGRRPRSRRQAGAEDRRGQDRFRRICQRFSRCRAAAPLRRLAGRQGRARSSPSNRRLPRRRPAGPRDVTVHRFDLEGSASGDVVVSGVSASSSCPPTARRLLPRRATDWFIQPPSTAAAARARAGRATRPRPADGCTEDRRTSKSDRSRAPSGSRCTASLAHPARDLLRSRAPRAQSRRLSARSTSRYLDGIASRRDLNYLFADMLGEVTVGHLGVGGGDSPTSRPSRPACSAPTTRSRTAATASRGSTTARTGTRASAPRSRSPASTSNAGEYLLAVNGRDLTAADNVYSFFEATAGKNVVIQCRPESRRHRRARRDGRAGAQRRPACATSPGSRTTAARWTS